MYLIVLIQTKTVVFPSSLSLAEGWFCNTSINKKRIEFNTNWKNILQYILKKLKQLAANRESHRKTDNHSELPETLADSRDSLGIYCHNSQTDEPIGK